VGWAEAPFHGVEEAKEGEEETTLKKHRKSFELPNGRVLNGCVRSGFAYANW
jgi:hypothetical protein